MGLRVGIAAAVGLVALACLASGSQPAYDAWAWLVWGEESTRFDLDTTAGPSWKPLPVAVSAMLSVAGEAAPRLWLIIAWAGFMAAPLAAAALAARLTLRRSTTAPARPLENPRSAQQIERSRGKWEMWAAAGLAAAGGLLLYDEVTPWVRQAYGGLTEPLLVTLVLAAVERALAGRHMIALALAVAACLLRPEAWPFALAYGFVLVRRSAHPGRAWAALAAAVAAVAAAWFVPDLLAAGNAFEGAGRARAGEGEEFGGVGDVLWRAAQLPSTVLLLAALLAWRGDRIERLLLAGALAWILLVAALAIAGYAGLPRFMAPAAALLITLGAANITRLSPPNVQQPGPGGGLRDVRWWGAALAVSLAVDLGWRGAQIPGDLDEARDRSEAIADVRGVVRAAGVDLVGECAPAPASIATTHLTAQTALAWELGVPIERIQVHSDGGGLSVILAGPDARVPASGRSPVLAERDGWVLLGPGC